MKRYITRIIFALLAAIIVLLPLLPTAETETFPAPSGFDFTNEIRWRYSLSKNEEFQLCFFTADKEICRLPLDESKSYRPIIPPNFTLDRSAAVVISEREKIVGNLGGKLYLVNHSGATHISDNVHWAAISDDGTTVAYLKHDIGHGENAIGNLYLYKHGEHTCIDRSVSLRPGSRYCISPDGGTVAYCRAAGESFDGIVWNRGEYYELGACASPLAVADSMAHVYYTKVKYVTRENYIMYVKSGSKTTEIINSLYPPVPSFNRDFSEVYIDGRRTNSPAVIACGADRVYTLESHIGHFSDSYINFYRGLIDCTPSGKSPCSYFRYCFDTFRGQVANCGDAGDTDRGDICLINDDFSYTLLTPESCSYQSYQVSESGSEVLYCANSPDAPRALFSSTDGLLSANAESFVASPDLQLVYYVTADGALFRLDRTKNTPADFIAQDAYLPQLRAYPRHVNAGSFYTTHTAPGILLDGQLYFTSASRRNLYTVSDDGKIREIFTSEDGVLSFCLIGQRLFMIHQTGEYGQITDFYSVGSYGANLYFEDQMYDYVIPL